MTYPNTCNHSLNIIMELIGVGYKNASHDKSSEMQLGRPVDEESADLLKKALSTGSESQYKHALLLERLRDALLVESELLMDTVELDIYEKEKELAPRVFGWQGYEKNPSRKYYANDYESAWEKLRSLEVQAFRLEDASVSHQFFADLQKHLVNGDLHGVNSKHLQKYPYLAPDSSHLFTHPLIKKKKKIFKPSKKDDALPKKTISQIRMEKDLANKEAEIRKEMSIKFQASTIPASTLIPKYKEIIANQGTKTMEIREIANRELINKLDQKEKEIVEDSKPRPFKSQKVAKSKLLEPKKTDNPFIDKECTFTPKIGNAIPNFKKAQEGFEKVLENSRSQKSTTIPQPFAMLSRPKKERRRSSASTATSNMVVEDNVRDEKEDKPKKEHRPAVPKTTRTMTLKIEHLKSKMEEEKLNSLIEEEQKRADEERKRATAERIRMRLKNTNEARAKEMDEKQTRHAEYQKTLQKQFTKTLDEMKKRIDSRPTLFEQVQLEAVRNHQRKKIDMILQSAGVEVIDL